MSHHRKHAAACLVALLLFAMLPSCSGSPTARWAQAREGLTFAEQQLVSARHAGKLSDDNVRLADVGVKAARQALADAEKKLPEGGAEFQNDLDLVRATLDRLAVLYPAKEK